MDLQEVNYQQGIDDQQESSHHSRLLQEVVDKVFALEANLYNVQRMSMQAISIERSHSKSIKKRERIEISGGDGTSSDSGFEEESDSEIAYRKKPFSIPARAVLKGQNQESLVQSQIRSQRRLIPPSGDSGIEEGSTSAAAVKERNDKFDDEEKEIIRSALNSVPRAIPIITSQYSLKPDMMFGWRPQMNVHGAPIPLYFDYESFDIAINPYTNQEYEVNFYGHRFKDSLEMHKTYANLTPETYKFKFPPNINVIEAMQASQKRKREDYRPFIGMNPILTDQNGFICSGFKKPSMKFDSKFECGNLDMAIQIRDQEYDLYMRVDSNTRGHHQWFYFTIYNKEVTGKTKFNIVNFTKNASLYHQGMKINIFSQKDYDQRVSKGETINNEGWFKGGENIQYKISKLSQMPSNYRSNNSQQTQQEILQKYLRSKKYFQLTFEYDFKHENDKVQFAYSVPFTYTKLYNHLKQIQQSHQELYPETSQQFIKESQLCKSLSGLEVPMLTVTKIDPEEFTLPDQVPLSKYKKYIIVCSRVHPGETNASFIMQGFMKFITSPTIPEAIELRKRIIFKIVPMTNPDGVIVGNYRTSLSGSDLNRQFIAPNIKLHPTVCAIKSLVSEIIRNAKEREPISSFIDIHGHSRKKSIFIYGPYFPLHNERYLKMRVLPKLLSERTDMFRFYSCKFRIQKSKLKAARVVLWKEFNIMNCFTLEASFHGFIDKDRQTVELTIELLENMGSILGNGFYEYQILIEEDEKQRLLIKQQIKNKKKKMKAKDIVNALGKQSEQQIVNLQQKNPTLPMTGTSLFEQFFSSEVDEKDSSQPTTSKGGSKTGQSTSKATHLEKITESSQAALEDSKSQNDSQNQRKILNMKQNSSVANSSYQSKKDTSSLAGTEQIVTPIIEAKRSSAESSPRKSQPIASGDTENLDIVLAVSGSGVVVPDGATQNELNTIGNNNNNTQEKKKPFRIKKQKSKQNGQGVKVIENQVQQKRTLKEIYKLLKRDVKTMTLPQESALHGDKQMNNNSGGFSSNSSDEDDDGEKILEGDDDDDCCCDRSMGYDDLTPSELEEIQGDIIQAIEKFDQMYNNSNGNNGKGSRVSANNKANIKIKKQNITQNSKQPQNQNQLLGQSEIKGSNENQSAAVKQKLALQYQQPEDMPKVQNSAQNKNAQIESMKKSEVSKHNKLANSSQLVSASITSYNFTNINNMIQYPNNQQNQQIVPSNKSKRQSSHNVEKSQTVRKGEVLIPPPATTSNYHKYIISQGNQPSSYAKSGTLAGMLSNSGALQNLSVSGIMYKAAVQVQNNTQINSSINHPMQMKLNHKGLIQAEHRLSHGVTSSGQLEQDAMTYQGITNNVRNLLKFKGVAQSQNQRNSLLNGQNQLLVESRSQDRCKPGQESQNIETNGIMLIKSFEEYKIKNPSKSNNSRFQKQETFNHQLNQSQFNQYQHQYEIDTQTNDPSLQSKTCIQNSSKSSRLIFIEKDNSQVVQKKKNNRTPNNKAQIDSGNESIIVINPSSNNTEQENNEIGTGQHSVVNGGGANSSTDYDQMKRFPYSLNQKGEILRKIAARQREELLLANSGYPNNEYAQIKSDNEKYNNSYNFKTGDGSSSRKFQHQLSMSNNQSMVIQNIIINQAPVDSSQRPQVQSPSADQSTTINQDLTFRDQAQKGKKKRKSKRKKLQVDPIQRIPTKHETLPSNFQVVNSHSHQNYLQNSQEVSQNQDQARKNFTGTKFNPGYQQPESFQNPYQEKSSNHQSNKRLSSESEPEEHKISNALANQSKIAQMATQHIKKHSAEFVNLVKSQEKDVIGSQVLYNLRPLKDLIINNMSQIHYIRSQQPELSNHQNKNSQIKRHTKMHI